MRRCEKRNTSTFPYYCAYYGKQGPTNDVITTEKWEGKMELKMKIEKEKGKVKMKMKRENWIKNEKGKWN